MIIVQHSIDRWQKKTFPESTPLSKTLHLEKEVVELKDEFLKVNPDPEAIANELADCFILLIGIAGLLKLNIVKIVWKKFRVIKKRTWNKPTEDGVYFHVKK